MEHTYDITASFYTTGHQSEDWKDHEITGIFSYPLYKDGHDIDSKIYTCHMWHPYDVANSEAALKAPRAVLGFHAIRWFSC